MGRVLLLFLFLFVFPLVLGEELYTNTETFTVTQGNMHRLVLTAPGAGHERVTLEFDMEITTWRNADLPGNGNNGNWQYTIGALRKGPADGFLAGIGLRATRDGSNPRTDLEANEIDHVEAFNWQTGTYRVALTVDAKAQLARFEVSQGGTVLQTITANLPHITLSDLQQGLVFTFGGLHDSHNYYVQPLNWRYSNIVLTGDASTGTPSDNTPITLPATPAGNYEPDEEGEGEPVELLRADGQFFEAPFGIRCPTADRTCSALHWVDVPTNGDFYEKFTVAFDFTTDDVHPAGWYQQLVQVWNTCSDAHFWRFLMKHPHGGDGQAILDTRGHPSWLAGHLSLAPNTQYRAEIVLDFLDEESYVRIFDAAGTLLQTVGDRINSDASNVAHMEATADGFTLMFGFPRDLFDRIIGQPHHWTFANLVVTGVPLGMGTNPNVGPGGADLSVDEGRLAFLAAQLLSVAEGEHTLDCGPANEVLNTPPAGAHPPLYCVLKDERQTIVGTFGDDGEAPLLASFIDPLYELDVDTVATDACDTIDALEFTFQECTGAVQGRKTYAGVHIDSGTSFLVVGERTIDAFDTTLVEAMVQFFKGIFGLGAETNVVGMTDVPLRRFHHGYFADIASRRVAATWNDDAVLFFRGFITDFNTSRPEESDFFLGDDKQVITLQLNRGNQDDVALWRRLTAALRVTDVPGAPIQGDVCGNDNIGYEEQCEPNLPVGSCEDMFFGTADTVVRCFPPGHERECQLDLTSCFADPGAGCFDTWTQPISPNPCAPSHRDPACDRDGNGGDGGGGGDGGDGGDGPPPPTGDACPNGEAVVMIRGVYSISTRAGPEGQPQINIQHTAPPGGGTTVCTTASGSDVQHAETHFDTWFDHNPGQEQILYYREKFGGGKHWDTKVILRSEANKFVITGSNQPDLQANGCGKSGCSCWACGESDKFCTNMNLQFPLAAFPTCDPHADPGATCDGACCKLSNTCTKDEDCCGGGVVTFCNSQQQCQIACPPEGCGVGRIPDIRIP